MGLDVTAYEQVTLVEKEHEREDEEGRYCGDPIDWGGLGHIHAYIPHDSFAQSARGLELDRCYTRSGETHGFRAGSYSGYNAWREALCEVALGVEPAVVWDDPDAYRDKPFFELIDFSDCEGSIGPEAAADLARDFQEHRETVRTQLAELWQGWGAEAYDDWQKAFELAADTGLVDFH